MLISFDDHNRNAKVALLQTETLKALMSPPDNSILKDLPLPAYTVEYAKWMIEGIPGKPYSSLDLHSLLAVEDNMKYR
jgi:hypothetical protein